jgi:hypothetical protein
MPLCREPRTKDAAVHGPLTSCAALYATTNVSIGWLDAGIAAKLGMHDTPALLSSVSSAWSIFSEHSLKSANTPRRYDTTGK